MNSSPIFPSSRFTSERSITAPENQVCQQGGVALSIVLAEPTMFVEGFHQLERQDIAPAMLRGTLVVSVTKATKIKAVTLAFKGQARTEWPEGIPPKRLDTMEAADIHCHVWNFYNVAYPTGDVSSGADLVRLDSEHRRLRSESRGRGDLPRRRNSITTEPAHILNERHSRRDSLDSARLRSESSHDSASSSSLRFLASRFRRSGSPATHASSHSLSSHTLSPHRSFSRHDPEDPTKKGYRMFEPGEYMYNFELAIPQSVPETIQASYGSVHYALEATVERSGTFKSNLVGRKEISIVRTAASSNLESSEPISIAKDWEDQLHYEIAVGGKSFSIGSSIPVNVRMVPLCKTIKCHRMRVYVTETVEYYCRNKKVHRVEPTRKFLIHEHQADRNGKGSLLHNDGSSTDLEYSAVIPDGTAPSSCSKGSCSPFDHLRPNTGYDNIQVHHWLKIVMRLSRPDPKDDKKQKYYEISIDSPISLLDKRCTMANLALPQYTFPSSTNTLRLAMPTPVPQTPGGTRKTYEDWPLAPPTPSADMPPPSYDMALTFGRHIEGEERPVLHRTTTTVHEAEVHDDSSSNASINEDTFSAAFASASGAGEASTSATAGPSQNSNEEPGASSSASSSSSSSSSMSTAAHSAATPEGEEVDDEVAVAAEDSALGSGSAESTQPGSLESSSGSFLDEFPAELRRPLLGTIGTRQSMTTMKDLELEQPELGQYTSEAWLV